MQIKNSRIEIQNRFSPLLSHNEKIENTNRKQNKISYNSQSKKKIKEKKSLTTFQEKPEMITNIMNNNLQIPAEIGKNAKTVKCLIDTGSNINCLNAKLLPEECTLTPPTSNLYGATLSSQLNYIGNSKVPFKLEEKKYTEPMRIVENLSCDLLLGMNFIRKHGVIINRINGIIKFADGMIIIINNDYLNDLDSTIKREALENIANNDEE